MKILALGAHPDDIEIFMYGLLAVCKHRGDDISTIIVTDGAKGGYNEDKALKKTRKKEAILGLENISKPFFLDIPDGKLGDDPNHKKKLREKIFEIMPDLVVTHDNNDYHADHRNLSLLTTSVVCHYFPIIYCDTLMGINFQPNYYLNISSFFNQKKEAILKHLSQNPKRFVDLSILMNRYRSAQCNGPKNTFAEAYSFIPSFPFSDIKELLPASPQLKSFSIKNKNGFL